MIHSPDFFSRNSFCLRLLQLMLNILLVFTCFFKAVIYRLMLLCNALQCVSVMPFSRTLTNLTFFLPAGDDVSSADRCFGNLRHAGICH